MPAFARDLGRQRYALQPALERFAERERAARRAFGSAAAELERARARCAANECGLAALRCRAAADAVAMPSCVAHVADRMDALLRRRTGLSACLGAALARTDERRAAFERARSLRQALERHRARGEAALRRRAALREAAEFDERNALGRRPP